MTATEPHSPRRARTLLNAVTQMAVWADATGLPLDAAVVLRPSTIDRFVVEGCRELSKGTKTNYRTQLRAVGRRVLSADLFPPRPVTLPRTEQERPYEVSEVAATLAWARSLPTTRMQRNLSALLGLGLGAGLVSQEMTQLIGEDVVRDSEGVFIRVGGAKARQVPVVRGWEDVVADLAAESGRRPFFLPDRTEIRRYHIVNFIEGCHRPNGGPQLSVERLRITWIVNHLTAGIPVQVVARAAGVQPAQLTKYFTFVSPLGDTEARRLLREAGNP